MVRKKIKNYMGRNFSRNRTKDSLSKDDRSELMSKIKSKRTKFEEDFISFMKDNIHEDFIFNDGSIRGKPDIVLKGKKLCVFLDSDFWHGWQYPRWKQLLKNDFWREKIERNRKRDRIITTYLRRKGWMVLRIWEHSIKENSIKQVDRINKMLDSSN